MDRRCEQFYLCFLVIIFFSCAKCYSIPDVRIELLEPKGFRASIPDSPKISLFAFHANVRREIKQTDTGMISGEVLQADQGRWTFVDLDVDLHDRDVINYYVHVIVDRVGYVRDNLVYVAGNEKRVPLEKLPAKTTTARTTTTTTPERGECQPTLTQVQSTTPGQLCSGQFVFWEDFHTALDPLKWRIEHKIALDNPDTPFVSYQRERSAVDMSDGGLRIKPVPLHLVSGHENYVTSILELDQCSSDREDLCVFRPSGSNIPPPVVSGRITSIFAFRYGIVTIRAKLPQGDWLFPEILLQPVSVNYPHLYNKVLGIVKIAMARGNLELHDDYYRNFGNNFLQGGLLVVDKNGTRYDFRQKTLDQGMWGDKFHIYSVKWTPDVITLSVDEVPWGQIDYSRILSASPQTKPFNEYFAISLGVAAGGDMVFPDDLTTGGNAQKPWRNKAAKAKVNFWRSANTWYPSWSANSSQLIVDFVKVRAL